MAWQHINLVLFYALRFCLTFSVRYIGYSFFIGAVHMWQRTKSNEQAFKIQNLPLINQWLNWPLNRRICIMKNKSGLCVSFFFWIVYKKSLKISDNQKPLIEEEQTIQWPQQKHNRTKKSTQKTKEEHEPTKNWGEQRCSGKVSKSCSTCGTRRVTLSTNRCDKSWMRE